MKVFIDGTPFLIEKTGIGHYTENLLLALGRIDPGLQLGLFTISLRRSSVSAGTVMRSISPLFWGLNPRLAARIALSISVRKFFS